MRRVSPDLDEDIRPLLFASDVMEYNADAAREKFREIARAMGVKNVDAMSPEEYKKAAVDSVRQFSIDVGIPQKLSEIGVKEEDIPILSRSAFQDVCTPGNPRDVVLEDIEALFVKSF